MFGIEALESVGIGVIMSRAATGDTVELKPGNNVYTVLVIVAALVNIIGFVLLFMRFSAVFGDKASMFNQ
jgi:hypothetical protein